MSAVPALCTSCRRELAATALFCPNCGTPRARDVATDELLGTVLADRFLVIDRLGAGKSGTIYRGEHVTLRRKVAIKVLHHELSRDDLAIERFRREATSVAEIDNEHIVEIHDFGRTGDGRLYLAMELLEGETLDNVLVRDGRLPIDRALDVMIQVAEALTDAHAVGFVHRDLRPRNLYLSVRRGKANFVKLLDFGLSKLVEAGAGGAASTSLGMTFGDPRYMSPEQAKGDPTDRRSDLYSLGCIAMEMLTGEPPFIGGRVFDVLTRHVSEPAPRLASRRADVPAWLDTVIARLLAKNPDDRFVTAARLAEVLRGGGAVAIEEPLSASGRRGPTGTPAVGVPAVAATPAPVEAPPIAAAPVEVAPVVSAPVAAPPVEVAPVVSAPVVAPPIEPAAALEPTAGERIAIPVGVADAPSGPVADRTDRMRQGSEADDAPRSREDLAPDARRGGPADDARLSGAWFADGDGADPGASGAASLDRARSFIDPGDSLSDDYQPPRTNYKPFVIAGGAALLLILALVVIGGRGRKDKTEPTPTQAASTQLDAAPAEPVVDAGVPEPDAAATAAVVEPPRPADPRPTKPTGVTPPRPVDPIPVDPTPPGGGASGEAAQLAEFYAKAGDAALRGGDPVGAASNYQKALSSNPKNVDAITGLGEVALSQGQYSAGITQLKKAARLAPRRARIHTLLGEAYLNTGNAVAAEASFKKALQLDPDDARARNGYNEAAGRLPPPSDDP